VSRSPPLSEPLSRLSRALGHEFASAGLLEAAVTHRSVGSGNNERLEFVGDAVLGLVVAEALHERRPKAPEGELTRLRAALVKKSTLAEIATALGLGDYLRLGAGERKSGGFRRGSILADALEALFGAIYLDSGYDAARACILRLLGPRLDALPEAADIKDSKSRLQELLQARGLERPSYAIERIEGEAHEQLFTVRVEVRQMALVEHGAGSSRQDAEQESARRLLERIAHG
jgi:ribonuclease III